MEEKKTFEAVIERGEDGIYSVYIAEPDCPFGCSGTGDSVAEAKEDFYAAIDDVRAVYEEEGKAFPEVEFAFRYDMASFLADYSKAFTLAGLSRITGVNQGQLSHYITGHRHPSDTTMKKIESSIHAFAKDLSQVRFV